MRTIFLFLKLISRLSFVILIGWLFPFCASALDFPLTFGVELQSRELRMLKGFGDGLFTKRVPQLGFNVGLQFTDHVSLEGGWFFSQRITRTAFSRQNTAVMGILYPPGVYTVSQNKIRFSGGQVVLKGQYPIGSKGFYAFGSAGIVALTMKAEYRQLLQVSPGNVTVVPNNGEGSVINFSVTKVIPRVAAGLGYRLSDQIRVYAQVGYEFTSKFKGMAPVKTGRSRLSLKNSVLWGFALTARY